jgi:hypothetical protein
MSLNDFDKKALNDLIDHTIDDIEPIVEFARMPELRSMYIDKDGSDFSLGAAVTEIITAFVIEFKIRTGRSVSVDEKAEMINILGKRIHEIKEAIFKCG